jgi:preprotein translocase subunit SecF
VSVTTTETPGATNGTGESPKKKSIWYRLYHGETGIDFMGQRRRWFIVSGVVILIGMISLFTRGLNFGIDFRGGTSWEVQSATLSQGQTKSILSKYNVPDAKIEVLNGANGRIVRVQGDIKGTSEAANKEKTDIRNDLAAAAKVDASKVAFNDVGPSWGKQISQKALRALIIFLIIIAAYISFRFEWKMAVAALIALGHDILVTVGVYSVSGFAVTPGTVIAFLTILGYSLYDTIVVFDRVGENARGLGATGKMTYSDVVNLSMNQTLMRSLNTSLVAIMPVLSVLILGAYVFGATALEDFGLALTIGLLTGAYSSIFIASPLLGVFKEREPRYTAIRNRLASRASGGPLTPAAAAASALGASPDDDGGPPLRPAAASAGAVSRPAAQGGSATTRPAGRPGGGNRPAPRPPKKRKRR